MAGLDVYRGNILFWKYAMQGELNQGVADLATFDGCHTATTALLSGYNSDVSGV